MHLVRALSISLLTILSLSACSEWPPQSDDLTEFVNQHDLEIEELVTAFKESGLELIECHLCWDEMPREQWEAAAFETVDGVRRQVDNPRGRLFVGLMDRADTGFASRISDDVVELGLEASVEDKNRAFMIKLFHDTRNPVDTPLECINEHEDVECGVCKVSAADSLYLSYTWMPHEIDPELTEQLRNGDISGAEWEQRTQELFKACWRDGVIEQGYSSDVR